MISLPRLTVGIVTYNSARTISQTLRSLAQQTLPSSRWKILFVDHNSQDETSAAIARFISENPELHSDFIRREDNNLARSRQFILESAQTPWTAFIDSDVVLPMNWFENALTNAEASTCVPESAAAKKWAGIAGPLRLRPLSHRLREVEILQGQSLGHFGSEQMMISKKYLRKATHLPTAAVLFRTKVLLENGGFNTSLKCCGEDLEIGERLRARGFEFWIASQLEVDHLLSIQSKWGWWRRTFLFGRARVRVARLHPMLFMNYRLWLPLGFALTQILISAALLVLYGPHLGPVLAALAGFWCFHLLTLGFSFFRFRKTHSVWRAALLLALTHQAYAWGEFYELLNPLNFFKTASEKAPEKTPENTIEPRGRRVFRRPNWFKALALRKT